MLRASPSRLLARMPGQATILATAAARPAQSLLSDLLLLGAGLLFALHTPALHEHVTLL